MNRRKFILGTGVFAAGSASALGTGAFTSVSANRTINVSVAGDGSALLRLGPCKESPNAGYVTGTDDGTMDLALSPEHQTAEGGQGVNPDATTVIDNVFEICNQGTQPVGVWLNVDPIQNANDEDAISFYQDSDQHLPIVGEENAVCLGVGDCVCVGLVTRTQGIDAGTNLLNEVSDGSQMIVNADADAAGACSDAYAPQGSQSINTGSAGWKIAKLPDGVDPKGDKTPPYDATTITKPNSAYYNPSAGDSKVDAQWIGPFDDDATNSDPDPESEDPYVYTLEFSVDAGTRTLDVNWFGADNPVKFYLVNGSVSGNVSGSIKPSTLVGQSSNGTSYGNLESGFTETVHGGEHTLIATVVNEPNGSTNPTALLVDGKIK